MTIPTSDLIDTIERYRQAEAQVRARLIFRMHGLGCLLGNLLLLALDSSDGQVSWEGWTALVWGSVLSAHYLIAYPLFKRLDRSFRRQVRRELPEYRLARCLARRHPTNQ